MDHEILPIFPVIGAFITPAKFCGNDMHPGAGPILN